MAGSRGFRVKTPRLEPDLGIWQSADARPAPVPNRNRPFGLVVQDRRVGRIHRERHQPTRRRKDNAKETCIRHALCHG